MLNFQKLPIYIILMSIPFLGFFFDVKPERNYQFHSKAEVETWDEMILTDPLFLTSDRCQQCHGFDTAMIASITLEGTDINVYDDWKTTMMANSAVDPFWRAKVSHEVMVQENYKDEIETKCTSCHAPMGQYNAFHNQQDHYTINDLLADTLGLDGVGCLACHQQSDFQLGSNHSGTLYFDTAKVAYGPFVSPLSSPMLAATMYKPVYSTHISDAGNCAGCHSLVTETFDLGGEPTGNTFVEQATYHEWLNSVYEPQDISCQTCHMPVLEGTYKLIAGFDTEERSPFYLHDLVGANTMMLKLLKENANSLGIEASDEAFDETIDKTLQMLQQRTLDLDFSFLDRTEDTCFVALELKNKAGHKFPSGYPARRAVISLLVQNENGDTLFHSGKMDDNYNVIAHDDPYEPHYQVITDESQAQIYEMVIADVAGNPTTVLTRADHLLKDNRLVPEGFSMSHPVYDTTQIAGQVLSDPDFNNQGSGEGSGTDMIFYNIPMNGFVEPLQITASVYYQSVPERWLEEMFAETSSEIDLFKSMYEEADRSPVLVKSVSDQIEGIKSSVFEEQRFSTFVELVRLANRSLLIKSNEKHQLSLFDMNGRLLKNWKDRRGDYEIQLPEVQEVYILQFLNEAGEVQVEKIF